MPYRALLIPATLALLAACGGGAQLVQPQPLPAEARVFYDENAGIRDSSAFAIRDRDTLERTWRQVTETRRTPPALTDVPGLAEVDFRREMLLVLAGGRLTRGDRVRIENVARGRETDVSGKERDVLMVRFSIIEGCGTLPDPAYPVEIVRVPKYDGTVRFQGTRSRAPGC